MTLAEVLVTVAILGIAISAIVAGLGTASMSSDRHRKQATADGVVRSYAEVIKQRSSLAYQACAAATTYIPAPVTTPPTPAPFITSGPGGVWSPPTGYSVTVSPVEFWHADTSPAPGNQPGFTSACPDEGAQRLALSASSSDGRDTERLQVIVRRP
jgi:type II secretory pathway pseudopilin PulG